MAFRHTGLRTPILALTLWLALAPGAWAQDATESEQGTATLPTVVISGSKRDQRLDSLNGAASVAQRTDLDDSQAHSTLDLSKVFPELLMSFSGSQPYPTITLRGVTSAQDVYSPALTAYVDGVPQLPTATIQSLIDVERVELLKGPQGTLYGKSAQGGVLNIVTHQPDNTLQALLRVGLSDRGGYQAQARVSGPLVRDLFYGDLALTDSKVVGEVDSPVLGKALGSMRSRVGNFKLRLAPAGNPWELGLSGGRDCMNANPNVFVPYDEIGSRTAYALDTLPAEFRNTHQRRCVDALAARGLYQWDDWQLNAIVSAQRLKIEQGFAFGSMYAWLPEQWRQNTQELRLSTRPRDAQAPALRNWDGVFGLYRQQVRRSDHATYEGLVPVRTPMMLDSRSHVENAALSAYGDMTWYVMPKIDLSAGLRLSRDTASTDFAGQMMGAPFSGQRSTRQNTWLGRVGAGYQFTPQWRGYVNVSQGYKPAGYTFFPMSAADADGFGRERSSSYEVGARYASKDLRMSIAAYRVNTRNTQLYYGDDVGYLVLRNMGDARSTGLEFSAEWEVTRDWELAASGFLNDARFTRYVDSSACVNCSGNRVPFVPKHGWTLAAKGRVSVGDMVLRPRVAVRYLGRQYFNTANTLKQDGYTLIDAGLVWAPRRDLEVAFYVNNLTNKVYRTYGISDRSAGNLAQLGAGRSLGVTLTYTY